MNKLKELYKNRTVIGVTSIVMALIICFALTPLFNNAIQAKTKVVRIIRDVKEGEEITLDKVMVMEVGKYNLPQEILKNKDDVVGKYAKADLYNGDYVLGSKVSSSPIAENKYLYQLDGDKEAISITIKSFAAGLSGKLETGDIISIIASDYGEFRETITPKELQYVRVLSTTTAKGTDKELNKANENKEEQQDLATTITLIVNKTQAKLLAELEQASKIHVVLAYRGNEEGANKFLEEQAKVISGGTAKNPNDNVAKKENSAETNNAKSSEIKGGSVDGK